MRKNRRKWTGFNLESKKQKTKKPLLDIGSIKNTTNPNPRRIRNHNPKRNPESSQARTPRGGRRRRHHSLSLRPAMAAISTRAQKGERRWMALGFWEGRVVRRFLLHRDPRPAVGCRWTASSDPPAVGPTFGLGWERGAQAWVGRLRAGPPAQAGAEAGRTTAAASCAWAEHDARGPSARVKRRKGRGPNFGLG